MKEEDLVIRGVNLARIRNKNEVRVARLFEKVMADDGVAVMDPLDIQDAYALSLNLLPSRYRQAGTIVLSEPVKDSHIESAIRRAIRTVLDRPKR
ncbi:MAG: late competence development ComFB family protein [Thermodesulfobacteriota bacterium]